MRGVHPLAYRLLCLSAHYRSELEFSADAVDCRADPAQAAGDDGAEDRRIRERRCRIAGAGLSRPPRRGRVSDDLNTPQALVALDELLADKRVTPAARMATLDAFDATLGLNLLTLSRDELRRRPAAAILTRRRDRRPTRRERQQARAAGLCAQSDAIRDALIAEGVEVMDGDPLRWEWKVSLD
jgi:cysteinyl-tRNA synthetase